jgi:hypothetical protein
MKKAILITFQFLLIAVVGSSQSYDFRKTNWGMSFENVKTTEASKFVADKNDRLMYDCILAGANFKTIYMFNDNNKLVGAKYMLDKTYSNSDFYVNEYATFKALLIKKYGNPVKESQNWNNTSISKEESNWGHALEQGFVSINAIWNTPTTNIKLSLIKLDKIYMQIDYVSIKYKEMESEEVLKKTMNEL